MSLVGANFQDTVLSGQAKEGKAFGLGQIITSYDGKKYVWLQASAAITGAGFVCFITTANLATMLSTANDAIGSRVAIAPAAMATGDQGWFQIAGFCDAVQVLASCAANARVNATATAGALDDDGTAGSMSILGLVLSTARAASPGTAPAILNYPTIGVVL
jgi:hypothetical protein